jgi:multiple sugar transport system permease protein
MRAFSKVILIVFCAAALAPLTWHAISSVKSASELARIPPTLLPHNPTLENYEELFLRRPFGRYYANSFIISVLASLLCIAAAAPCAYGLARASEFVRRIATSSMLGMAFFPPIVLLFPVYELVRAAGLLNQPWGLILPYAALNLPFTVWLLTSYFGQIPYELEEAAAMDGLSQFQTFTRVILPLAAPALVTGGLLVFVFAWNEFMFALTFMNMESARTITVGVATLSGAFSQEIPWGLLAAGVMVSSLPLIVLVMIFQKRIVAGLTAGTGK